MTTTAPPPWFRGFEVRPSTTITRFCGWPEPNTAQTFLSSGSWANCCETGKTTPCSIATTCLSSSVLVYNNGDRRTCVDSKTCVAQTYYQASPSVGPAVTLLMCATSLQPWPNYRSLEGAQYLAPNASLPWDYSSSISAAVTSAAATEAPVGSGGGGGGGNAHLWIAGAVLGPVVAIALGILAFWALSRRRRRRRNAEAGADKGASSSSSSSSSLSLDGGSQVNRSSSGNDDEESRRQAKREHAELGTIHNLHELDSPPAMLELPAGQYPGYYHAYSWEDATAPRPRAELDSTFSPVTPCLGPDGRPERPYKGWGWFGWV